jgi:hypothetical protein
VEILIALQALAADVSLQDVLALNVLGWVIKALLHHLDKADWTDIIPFILAVSGVALAFFDPVIVNRNFIVCGLANAGLAWLLHRVVKDGAQAVKQFRNKA